MTAPSSITMDVVALREELQTAQERITELESKLTEAEQAREAGTVLLIAALVKRLGGEVVLPNDELGNVSGELHSYDTFGGRVFRLVDEDEEDGPEPVGEA